ncbi:MAG TPA: DNA methyltransferase [Acidimicrobiales bacterium]|nr:DNA methyltransferase [Acidimicrobiales bacterium]
MTGAPWQLLPALDADEYGALKSDIAAHGIRVPVVVTAETGEVVDGHHRLRAWRELRAEGVRVPDYPRDVRRFSHDDERVTFVLAANLFRRHLIRAQRRELVASLRAQGWSLRRIADAVGVPKSTPGRDLATVPSGTVPERVVGKDGRSQPARRPGPSLYVRSRRDEERARAALAALGPDEPAPSNLLRAEERARKAALAGRRGQGVPSVTEGRAWEVRCGDFRDALADLPDASVDAIVTDPPYNAEGIPLFSDLAAFAARVLKPGRLLVTYSGTLALDETITRLGEHLDWVWASAVFLPGRHHAMRNRMIRSRWRPVLLFSAGRYEPRGWMMDATVSEGRGEKSVDDHHWQQTLGPFRFWTEQCTRPGDLVVDPFVGGGTTGLACLATGRRFLGCDLDPGAVSLSVERLRAAESGGTEGEGA